MISERTRLIAQIEKIEELENTVSSTYEMIELAEMENEVDLLKEAEDSFSNLDPLEILLHLIQVHLYILLNHL